MIEPELTSTGFENKTWDEWFQYIFEFKKKSQQEKMENAANKFFNKVGHVVALQSEDEMHRFTSIIGSGQAFLFQVLDTYLKELEKITTSDQAATKSMFIDFISSLGDSFSQEQNFESLINKIKSPGGTTQAGLESLKTNKLDKILQDAFQAAEDRSIEISNEQ